MVETEYDRMFPQNTMDSTFFESPSALDIFFYNFTKPL